jgi:tetratricopeptide (TPR) repeat protein
MWHTRWQVTKLTHQQDSASTGWKRVLLLLSATLLALTVGEVGIRATGKAPGVRSIVLRAEETVYKRSRNPILNYELKASYRNESADLNRSYRRTNAHGQRDVDREIRKPDGTRRIILLGDSVVMGVGLPDIDSTISRQLEQLYSSGKTEVLNFGVDGYNTLAEVELLRTKGVAFDPDLVVLLFVHNDFNDFTQEAWKLEGGRDYPPVLQKLFLYSGLFRMAAVEFNLFDFGVMADPERWNRKATGRGNVVRGLEGLNELAAEHDFDVLIAVWPLFLPSAIDDLHFLPGEDELMIERLARVHGMPCVRLSPHFNRHREKSSDSEFLNPRWVYTTGDGMHPSPTGSLVAAQALKAILAAPAQAPPAAAATPMPGAEAIELSAQFGEAAPHRARLLLVLADDYATRGDLPNAIHHLELAVELNPSFVAARMNLAKFLDANGDAAAAEKHLDQALLIDRDNPKAHNNLGMILLGRNDVRRAQLRFERAHALQPESADFCNNLGLALDRQGQLADAVSWYAKAIALNPAHADAHVNLGVLYANRKRYAEAIRHLQIAIAADPELPQAHYNLGILLELQGDPERARARLEAAAALDSKDRDARAALERVRAALREKDES